MLTNSNSGVSTEDNADKLSMQTSQVFRFKSFTSLLHCIAKIDVQRERFFVARYYMYKNFQRLKSETDDVRNFTDKLNYAIN